MPLPQQQKNETIDKYQAHEKDTGSAKVQVALLSGRIKQLQSHFEVNKKDHASRRGLLKMVARRRKLLSYLKKHNEEGYRNLIGELGIRK